MNIITWKAYLRNSYYEYELARNLATCSKNPKHLFSVSRIIRFRMFSVVFLNARDTNNKMMSLCKVHKINFEFLIGVIF